MQVVRVLFRFGFLNFVLRMVAMEMLLQLERKAELERKRLRPETKEYEHEGILLLRSAWELGGADPRKRVTTH